MENAAEEDWQVLSTFAFGLPGAPRIAIWSGARGSDGDFFSKDNIKPGYATLHPRGIHHGPHPKALANQHRKSHTDEYAVMLDGLNPIHVLPANEQVEWKEYWASWMAPAATIL